ncbi:right-handed parallel beta-helix repeat-containing protein [Planosporangium flavigriseum]|uniref:Right handed beta helix region n=1 Tax=Planosporangium flavigriseum TaxID=373681 RepID=A0A8J3PN62_9ACTN|nr:right-handed parallel beta-helix repeat-containing protein [Planosporangium flavigriseum]NJC65942.1 right-handed parallel beta-helix repeat-containing protein [Planosporangium flavigriseum]GIG75647.1 hypothetical protein Pfl04_40510 [Planosporangium flavigriseum]
MRLLEHLPTVVVTGQYLHPDGRPCRGSILIEPDPTQLTSADQGLVILGTVESQLDDSGRFAVELLATDAAGISPSDWRYRVTERWLDAPERTYYLDLPAAEADVNLTAACPAEDGERPGMRARGDGGRPRRLGRCSSQASERRQPARTAPVAPDIEADDPLIYHAREHGLVGDGRTNDQPALQALVDKLGDASAADGRGRRIYCPPGVYSIRDNATVWRSKVSLVGAGPSETRFVLSNPGHPTCPTPLAFFTEKEHGASRENHLADCTFARFEIDGSGVQHAEYDVLGKGLGLQYVLRGHFRDLYIHDTAATGFGCDFLQDTTIQDVLVVRCGRLNNVLQIGGAGIGIGVGGWGATERLTIANCTAVDNGTNGIFLELQDHTWTPPRGIRIIGCHAEGNRFGISDWGAEGLIVSACTMIANHEAGYDLSAMGTSSVAGRGGIVVGCVMDGNVRDGMGIGNTPGPYTFRGNRISRNGRYGYWGHNLAGGHQDEANDIALDGNEIWNNALCGVRLDADLTDLALVANRIRNNGKRAEPDMFGGGRSVSYTATSLVDTDADWRSDGHLGKWVTVGNRHAIVVANTATELVFAPLRPGATTAWVGGTPPDGTPYSLPNPPAVRAGISIGANLVNPTIRDNRIWDNQRRKTQTHGLWITESGVCESGWVEDNNLEGNAVESVRFDGKPCAYWDHNHGLECLP